MEGTKFKRLMSLFLTIIMVFTLIPFGVIPTTAASLDPDSDEADIFGYGFDVTGGKELDKQSLKKAAPILDTSNKELLNHVFVSNYNKSYSKNFVTDSAVSMSKLVYSDLGIGLDLKIGGSLFNIDGEFDTSVKEQITSAKQERYEYYYNQIEKKSVVLQLSLNQIKDYLSYQFTRDILAVTDAEDANALFDKYGTHLITGYILGGRLEITNYRITSDASKDWSSVNSLKATVGATVATVNGGGTVNFAEQHGSNETSSTTQSSYQAYILGGTSVGALSIDDLFTYNESLTGTGKYEYARWIDAVNEGTSLDIVGIDDDAGSIPLWDLLPNDSKYSELKQILLSAYIERCDGKYTEYLEKYPALVKDLSDEQEEESALGQIQIDGYYQSYPTEAGNVVNEIVFTEGQTTASVHAGTTIFMVSSGSTIKNGEKSWTVTGDGSEYVTVLDSVNGIIQISDDIPVNTTFKLRVLRGTELANGNVPITFTIVKKLFSGGDGSSANPYIISSKADLQYLRDNPSYWDSSYNYVLVNDIDYGSNETELVKPIGTIDSPFKATFDGNYHTISNCGASHSVISTIGLFGKVGSNGVIKNLTIENATITIGGETQQSAVNNYTFTGALVGINQGTIENCIVKNNTIKLNKTGNWAYAFAGGLVGENSGTIQNCTAINPTVTMDINATNCGGGDIFAYVGGLAGQSAGTITNCYVKHNETSVLHLDVIGAQQGWSNVTGGAMGLGGIVGHAGGQSQLIESGMNASGANIISNCVVSVPYTNNMNLKASPINTGATYACTLVGVHNTSNVPTISNCLSEMPPDSKEGYWTVEKGVNGITLPDNCFVEDATYEEVARVLVDYDSVWMADENAYPVLKSTVIKEFKLTGNQTSFYYGEEFNLVGIKTQIINGNDEAKDVSHFIYTTTEHNKESLDNYTAKISVCGQIKTYGITMNKCEIVDFSVSDTSEKLLFAGDTYNYQNGNLEIYVVLSNGQKMMLDLLNTESYIKYPTKAPAITSPVLSLGDNEITVAYNDITRNYYVNAVEKKVTSIEITKQPTTKNYSAGQTFSTKGLEVTATYQDGSSAVVNNKDLEIIGSTISFGSNVVSLSYTDYSNIETINIECTTGLFVRELPTKTSYYIGEEIDFTGLVLEYTTDGINYIPVSIDDCTVSATKIQKDDANEIIITYENIHEAKITLNGIGYTITFLDSNDNILLEKTYLPGEEITIPNAPDNVAGYKFAGWNMPIALTATSDAQYRAIYVPTTSSGGETVTIRFLTHDGKEISSLTYPKGTADIAIPVAPSRDGYTFEGWDKTITNATENKDYIAVYKEIVAITEYTIKFVDYDGRVISEAKYTQGSTVTIPQSPSRDGYTFTGWDKPISVVSADATYTAQYIQNDVGDTTKYLIQFFDMNNNLISQGLYEPGEAIIVPVAPAVSGYTFVGWDKTISPTATASVAYTAIYEVNTPSDDNPSDTPVNPNPPTQGTLLGIADVNGDGAITIDDANHLLRFIHFPSKAPLSASGDSNGDGKITSDDAIYIKNYIYNPTGYPIG